MTKVSSTSVEVIPLSSPLMFDLPFTVEHDWPSTEINFSQLAALDLPTHISASAIIQEFFGNFTRPA